MDFQEWLQQVETSLNYNTPSESEIAANQEWIEYELSKVFPDALLEDNKRAKECIGFFIIPSRSSVNPVVYSNPGESHKDLARRMYRSLGFDSPLDLNEPGIVAGRYGPFYLEPDIWSYSKPTGIYGTVNVVSFYRYDNKYQPWVDGVIKQVAPKIGYDGYVCIQGKEPVKVSQYLGASSPKLTNPWNRELQKIGKLSPGSSYWRGTSESFSVG